MGVRRVGEWEAGADPDPVAGLVVVDEDDPGDRQRRGRGRIVPPLQLLPAIAGLQHVHGGGREAMRAEICRQRLLGWSAAGARRQVHGRRPAGIEEEPAEAGNLAIEPSGGQIGTLGHDHIR